MLKGYWYAVVDKWKQVGWVPPYPTLDRHLEHLLGGMAFALIASRFGVEPLGCCLIATAIALAIEGLTAIKKGNWKDSIFDFYQYNLVWVVYLLPDFVAFGIALVCYFIVYSMMLLWDW